MFLKELTALAGVSGCEYEVRNYIKKKLDEIGCEYHIDKVGNVIAHNKGPTNSKKVMLAAHMDEVGLIITHIDDNGFLRFNTVGGIDQRVLNSKTVEVGEKKIQGVIGSKAIHLMTAAEREKSLTADQMYIDIGAASKEDAKKLISIGDYVAFKSEYTEFGDGMIKAKALDDRVGCSIILDLLSMKLDVDFYGVFTVMEEVGSRGAYTAAYVLQPDLGIVLEGTVSADMPEIKECDKVTTINGGAVISVMDGTTVYNIDTVRSVVSLAEKNGISYQYRRSTAGGNDSGPIHQAKEGSKTVAVSVPCRYIHSPVNVAGIRDYESALTLVKTILTNLSDIK